jgi:hypothetical protein
MRRLKKISDVPNLPAIKNNIPLSPVFCPPVLRVFLMPVKKLSENIGTSFSNPVEAGD